VIIRDVRMVKESPLPQGEDEIVQYVLTTTPWGSAPQLPGIVVKDETEDDDDVTNLVTQPAGGPPTVLGDKLTLPLIKSLKRNHDYRVEVWFYVGATKFEPYFIINAEQ
jgi:hypothetical protein